MMYNDFPILTENEYEFMNENFKNSQQFSRPRFLDIVCFNLKKLQHFSSFSNVKMSTKLKNCFMDSNITINKLINNLTSTFNHNETPLKDVHNLTIFSYLKLVVENLTILDQWIKQEHKEYYKTLISNTRTELQNICLNVLTVLESSNVYLFKHM